MRRRNVLPGRQTKQTKFSMPVKDCNCRFVYEVRDRHDRSRSIISCSLVSDIRASCLTLSSSIPRSSSWVHGKTVLAGFVVKPKSEQVYSIPWRLSDHRESGAGGPQVQKSSR